MHPESSSAGRPPLWRSVLDMLLLTFLLAAGTPAAAQTPPPTLPPGVQDVVKLARAGLSDDVILAQIKSAGASYALTADQII